MPDALLLAVVVTWLALAWVSIVGLIVWLKRVRNPRLVLEPGQIIDFYDPSKTILRARMVLTHFEFGFNRPSRAELESLDAFIERNTVRRIS